MSTAEMPNETYDWESARARMHEQAEVEYAPPWGNPPEPGDELFGVVTKFTAAAPTSFGPAPVVEVTTPEGPRYSLWLFHEVLRLAFERQRVELGETILVSYKGKTVPEGEGRPYHLYTLVVDRPDQKGKIDWNDVAERYGDLARDDEGGRASRPEASGTVLEGDEHPDHDDGDIPF